MLATSAMRSLLVLVTVPFVLLLGCATPRGVQARETYLRGAVIDQPIAKPVEQVWPLVKAQLFTVGAQVARVDDAFFVIETKPVQDPNVPTVRRWFDIKAQRLDTTSSRIQAIRITETTMPDGQKLMVNERDWQLEFDVLKMADPMKAVQLEAEGQRRFEDAGGAG